MSACLLPFHSHQQPYLQHCTFNNTFECPMVNTYPNCVSNYCLLIITKIQKRQRLLTLTLLAFATRTHYWGLPAHTTAMSHPYTTSPGDIFAPFHLKYNVPRWLAVSLMTTAPSKLILANTITSNWPTINQIKKIGASSMWYNLHRGSRQPLIHHHHLLLWTQVKFTIKYATPTSNTNANSISDVVTLQTDFHAL